MEPVSPYRTQKSRRLFLRGDHGAIKRVTQLLKPLEFLVPTPWEQYDGGALQEHLVIWAGSLATKAEMGAAEKSFAELGSPLSYRIIFATEPAYLRRETLLFCVEIGARYTAYGTNREEELRAHVKSAFTPDAERDTFSKLFEELIEARVEYNVEVLKNIGARLESFNKDREEVLRLHVLLNEALRKPRQVEFYLKRILELNPQSLWAANELGRHYIAHRDVARGIEVLEKLSRFHELSRERLHTLGNAYLNAGEANAARTAFAKGDELSEGEDARFRIGMGKADLLEGKTEAAHNLLQGRQFSADVISFLNMRAIMAMRTNDSAEGFRLYHAAVEGASGDALCSAKLRFNMGLAYARIRDLEKAEECFSESTRLGGREFCRAGEPLEIVRKIRAQSRNRAGQTLEVDFKDVSWESDEEKDK